MTLLELPPPPVDTTGGAGDGSAPGSGRRRLPRPIGPGSSGPRSRAPGRRLDRVLFAGCFAGYGVLGYLLNVHLGLVDNDGPSRVSDAGYVLFSRQPHLAAIGFVWNPLPSIVELPLLALRGVWPALQQQSVAGLVQSALFMAAAVVQIARIARDRGVSRTQAVLAVACFALNPMIVLYAGNGLSEASFLFFTLWAVRRLLLWQRSRSIVDLALAGVALGLDYLTRYEAAVAAVAAALVVVIATLTKGEPMLPRTVVELRRRLNPAMHRVAVLLFPIMLTGVMWTATSWLITGEAFAQFSSQYGNAAQLDVFQQGGRADPVNLVLHFVVSFAPLLPVLAVVAVALSVRDRDAALLVLGVPVGVLVFEAYGQISGTTAGWFRFFLMTVPTTVLLCVLLCPLPGSRGDSRWRRVFATVLTAAALVTSLPVTWSAMLNPAVGNQPQQFALRYLLDSPPDPELAPYYGVNAAQNALAGYLDALRLPPGSVLLDPFFGNQIWLASRNDKQFVLVSDTDFTQDLNDPAAAGIRYILGPSPVGEGSLNEVNRRYPTLWTDGAGIARPLVTFSSGPGQVDWRIYAVLPHQP